ncbi:MAG: hypothetical protein LBB27_02445 [Tannerellaceae bacterium]|jgi:hypothetical protein|nr:hypothetical protein [Tannerellaceae bacterium]
MKWFWRLLIIIVGASISEEGALLSAVELRIERISEPGKAVENMYLSENGVDELRLVDDAGSPLPDVTWRSSNPLLYVDNGRITAGSLGIGDAIVPVTVTAKASTGGDVSCLVRILPSLRSLHMSGVDGLSSVAICEDSIFTLKVDVQPASLFAHIKWSVTKDNLAEVLTSDEGRMEVTFRTKAAGNGEITAKLPCVACSVVGRFPLTVFRRVESISLVDASGNTSSSYAGVPVELSAVFAPADARSSFRWSLSDPSVLAFVGEPEGNVCKVRAIKAGVGVVRVTTDNGHTADYTLSTVPTTAVVVSNPGLAPTDAVVDLPYGTSFTLRARVIPSFSCAELRWTAEPAAAVQLCPGADSCVVKALKWGEVRTVHVRAEVVGSSGQISDKYTFRITLPPVEKVEVEDAGGHIVMGGLDIGSVITLFADVRPKEALQAVRWSVEPEGAVAFDDKEDATGLVRHITILTGGDIMVYATALDDTEQRSFFTISANYRSATAVDLVDALDSHMRTMEQGNAITLHAALKPSGTLPQLQWVLDTVGVVAFADTLVAVHALSRTLEAVGEGKVNVFVKTMDGTSLISPIFTITVVASLQSVSPSAVASAPSASYADGALRLTGFDGGYKHEVINLAGRTVATFVTTEATDVCPLSLGTGVYLLRSVKASERSVVKFRVTK